MSQAAVPASAPSPHPGMTFRGFVALIAALMAANAIAVDSMLPALRGAAAIAAVVGPGKSATV